jgi:outer membrane biosynthesis protein TonB
MPNAAKGSVGRTGIAVLITTVVLASPVAPQTPRAGPPARRIVSMEYPVLARMARLEGAVSLIANVLPDGTVGGVTVLSGPEPLATPAKEDVSKWRFDGCPSSASSCAVEIVFSFVLNGACTDSPRCPTEFQVDLPNRVLVTSQVYGKLLL